MPLLPAIPRPSRLTLAEVVALAAADVDDPRAELELIYGWYFERATATIRAAFATAGAILLAFLGAYAEDKLSTGEAAALASSTLPFVIIGAIRTLALNSLHREYVRAQSLLARLRPHRSALAAHWSWI